MTNIPMMTKLDDVGGGNSMDVQGEAAANWTRAMKAESRLEWTEKALTALQDRVRVLEDLLTRALAQNDPYWPQDARAALTAASSPEGMPEPQESPGAERVTAWRGLATELAREFAPIVAAFLATPPHDEQPVRDFLWNNKIAILRSLEFIAALRAPPSPARREGVDERATLHHPGSARGINGSRRDVCVSSRGSLARAG
jgi:hypothetical protein